MVDASGETRYCHDRRGNVVRKVQVTGGETFVTTYAYDLADRLSGIGYPAGGPAVSYTRDAQGRIVAVAINGTPLVSDVDYRPFGPVERIQFANGDVVTRDYDQNYWTTGVSSPALAQGLRPDDVGNITGFGAAPGAPVLSEQYTYDDLYRLAGVLAPGGTVRESFAYDATGNRTAKTRLGVTEAYAYPPTSHRLGSVAGVARSYDASGNTTAIGASTFTYDQRNRLATTSAGTSNHYNGRGERVYVDNDTSVFDANVSRFFYDEGGKVLADGIAVQEIVDCEPAEGWGCPPECPGGEAMRGETPERGSYDRIARPHDPLRTKDLGMECGPGTIPVYAHVDTRRFYIWLDDIPVGFVTSAGEVFAVHADHLNTPRALTTNTAPTQVKWRWTFESNPFGQNAANEDPDGDGIALSYPLRFPGQYLDTATGLHYNYFRDYEPGTGRYIESDPIGQQGGVSTYGYAAGSALRFTDRLGACAAERNWRQ
jgi:RHS repeat-associated protein